MRVVITGAAGFIGKKLAAEILSRGSLRVSAGDEQSVESLVLFDVVESDQFRDDSRVTVRAGDIGDPKVTRELLAGGADLVFHLAAIVSGNAEEDFDLGYHVNMVGTRNLLEACRPLTKPPVVVYASSTACFGAEMPELIPDSWILTPQSSYGVQKTIGELLLQDYRRKGFIDGRGLRLPTIIVRSGKPNKAASTFASSIIREPLSGQRTVCPVRAECRMYILSPRRAVESFLHAAELPADALGAVPSLTLPGLDVSIADLVAALGRAAGEEATRLIDWKNDPKIEKLVEGWPENFTSERAKALGFRSDSNVDEIVRAFIEDEMSPR